MPTVPDADGERVIDTRILALVVGASSLVFGAWSALADIPEMGFAAGVLGLFAGFTALIPRPAGTTTGDGTPERDADRAPVSAPRDAAGRHPSTHENSGDRGDDAAHLDGGTPAPAVESGFETEPRLGSSSGGGSTDGSGAGPVVGAPETSLTDPTTGLFSEDYLVVALESRLASARRNLRPVAVAMIEITQGLPGDSTRPADPEVVAAAVRTTVRDSDIACRLEDGTFGVILEDTPENGAVWTVERIRRNLVSTSGHHTLWAGVACYPAHAFDSDDLLEQVRDALTAAREWNQDRIEVAIAE
ncbi:MAG: GGDEF domain-containing protein [Microthrixaceae bacterium]